MTDTPNHEKLPTDAVDLLPLLISYSPAEAQRLALKWLAALEKPTIGDGES